MTHTPDNPNHKPIRFGVMCNGTSFRAWEARCLEHLLASDSVQPALLIVDAEAGGPTVDRRKLKNLRKLLWHAYTFIFARRSRAMRPVDMASAFADTPSMRCTVTRKGRYSEYFTTDDVEEIRRHDLDFVLRFGFNIIRGDVLEAARYGVWSFHHDDETKYRGSPPCFWEIYYGDPVTGAILQRLNDRLDAGVVLRRGFQKTIDTSYVRNRDALFFESAQWPAQVCIDLKNSHTDYLDAEPSKTSAPILYTPTNGHMVMFFLKVIRNALRLLRVFAWFDTWNVGIAKSPVEALLQEDTRPTITWLPPPRPGTFRADSFAIRREDDVIILYEDFDYRTSRGCISALTLRGADPNRFDEYHGVISGPDHLAYPYLFEHAGEVYCVPEAWESGEVTLYKAVDLPTQWTKVATLIDDYAGVDSTLFQHGERWWLFGTDQLDGPNSKLKVWFADDLFGPWQAHATNPVKTDPRSARPAGRPFLYDGQLYRPAQDCSKAYGERIVVNRVLRLTPYDFAEEPAGHIGADKSGPYGDGLHTVSGAGDVTIVDGMRRRFTLWSLPALGHKARRLWETVSAR
jgi:hypothetical protein